MRRTGLVSMCGLQFHHHPFPPTIFLLFHSLINVPCALWWCIIHQTKWPGQCITNHQGYSLFFCLSPAVTKRRRWFFIFCQLDIFSDRSNNLFPVPFECLTMCLLKEATKVYKPQGLRCGRFDLAGSHWWVLLQSKQQVVPLTVAAFYHIMSGFFLLPTSNTNCIIKTLLRSNVCEGICVAVRAPPQMVG